MVSYYIMENTLSIKKDEGTSVYQSEASFSQHVVGCREANGDVHSGA